MKEYTFEQINSIMMDHDRVKSLLEQRDIFVVELEIQRKEIRELQKRNQLLKSTQNYYENESIQN